MVDTSANFSGAVPEYYDKCLGPAWFGGTFYFSVWDRIEELPHAVAAANVVEGLFPGDPEMDFTVPYDLPIVAISCTSSLPACSVS